MPLMVTVELVTTEDSAGTTRSLDAEFCANPRSMNKEARINSKGNLMRVYLCVPKVRMNLPSFDGILSLRFKFRLKRSSPARVAYLEFRPVNFRIFGVILSLWNYYTSPGPGTWLDP